MLTSGLPVVYILKFAFTKVNCYIGTAGKLRQLKISAESI